MSDSHRQKPYKTVNLDDSEWPASKNALIKKLNFTTAPSDQAEIIWSDCQWEDNTEDPKVMEALKSTQTINYFPKSSETFRKDTLTENLNQFESRYPKMFKNVVPKSWNLPSQYQEFQNYVKAQKDQQYFIIKENDEQRGVGIRITDEAEKELDETSDVVVSKYIGNPLLVDGCKFDFRIHVLVASLDPFTVYVHDEGLMRMASFHYEKPNKSNCDNLYMHLTNLSLNKYNENSVHQGTFGDSLIDPASSNKKLIRSFGHFRQCLRDIGLSEASVEDTITEMDEMIGKVLIASYQDLRKNYEKQFGPIGGRNLSQSQSKSKNYAPQAFQCLGFDVMFDEFLQPWFIEVNHNPDFVDDPKIASLIVRKTVVDTIEKLSDINDRPFEDTPMTGETDYDLVYTLPNKYRRVDIGKIQKQMNREERDMALQSQKSRTSRQKLTVNSDPNHKRVRSSDRTSRN